MFERLKQIKKLREMQKSLNEQRVTVEKEGTRIVLDGNFEVIEISLNPQLSAQEQQKVLKECFNEGIKKLKFKIIETFQNFKT